MSQEIKKLQVPNVVLFKERYKQVVQTLVLARTESGMTKESLAEWLGVDRRKIFSFEKLKKVDIETMLVYADKFSIDVEIKFTIS